MALLALAILLFRPMVLDAMGMPFGTRDSVNVGLVKADGSPHCVMLADCETISIANAGLDLARTPLLPALLGAVITPALFRTRVLRSWATLVPNPPPLSVLS